MFSIGSHLSIRLLESYKGVLCLSSEVTYQLAKVI